jgi:hypothetical protein
LHGGRCCALSCENTNDPKTSEPLTLRSPVWGLSSMSRSASTLLMLSTCWAQEEELGLVKTEGSFQPLFESKLEHHSTRRLCGWETACRCLGSKVVRTKAWVIA